MKRLHLTHRLIFGIISTFVYYLSFEQKMRIWSNHIKFTKALVEPTLRPNCYSKYKRKTLRNIVENLHAPIRQNMTRFIWLKKVKVSIWTQGGVSAATKVELPKVYSIKDLIRKVKLVNFSRLTPHWWGLGIQTQMIQTII